MVLSDSVLRSAHAAEALLEHVRSLAPGLRIGEVRSFATTSTHDDAAEARWLAKDGYSVFPNGADDATRWPVLAEVIVRLVHAGLPAVFAYFFDEAWMIGEGLRARVSRMLGTDYVLAADGWAWCVEPGEGRGWGPHRDDGRLFSREAPERVNVWMALSDASAERSCIYLVPLDEDPGYPKMEGAPEAPYQSVRAVPVTAGTAMGWNSNLLHWGGTCSARAVGPRIAISYTLVRANAVESVGLRTTNPDTLTPLDRVDMVASMIKSYEKKGLPDVTPELMAWAAATWALRVQIDALRGAGAGGP